jgi:hypothetical protein
VRLTDIQDLVLRRGHLSERALMEALAGGERPAHLDRCDICAERAVALARWMDAAREDAVDAADAIFTSDRLAAQESQILRRLEQLDTPARVISFPAATRAERGELNGRRVAVSWVGVAAAAGLAIGIVGGQLSARLTQAPAPIVVAVNPPEAAATPVDGTFLEQPYDQLQIPALGAVDEITPRLQARSGG